MEKETTCPLTGGKAIEIFSKNFGDDCGYILENLFIKCQISAFNPAIDIINNIDIDEKTKLAGKLANFSMDYALNEGITYKVENSNNYPIYNEVINEEFLKKVKQEPMPSLNERIELFLKFLSNAIKIIPAIESQSLDNEQKDILMVRLEAVFKAISYTENRDWDNFIIHLREQKFIRENSSLLSYSVTIEGQELLKKKSNNKKIKNNSIETVKNNSNIRLSTQERKSVISEDYQLSINHERINNIFCELKDIKVNQFPNASVLLLRAFLELSIDLYTFKKKIEFVSENISLMGKLQKIIEHIDLTTKEKEPLTAIISNPHNPANIYILNSYTHNKDHHPDPIDSIKTAFIIY